MQEAPAAFRRASSSIQTFTVGIGVSPILCRLACADCTADREFHPAL